MIIMVERVVMNGCILNFAEKKPAMAENKVVAKTDKSKARMTRVGKAIAFKLMALLEDLGRNLAIMEHEADTKGA
jgi:hypothetical protein